MMSSLPSLKVAKKAMVPKSWRVGVPGETTARPVDQIPNCNKHCVAGGNRSVGITPSAEQYLKHDIPAVIDDPRERGVVVQC
jgi:hypothetical protein